MECGKRAYSISPTLPKIQFVIVLSLPWSLVSLEGAYFSLGTAWIGIRRAPLLAGPYLWNGLSVIPCQPKTSRGPLHRATLHARQKTLQHESPVAGTTQQNRSQSLRSLETQPRIEPL